MITLPTSAVPAQFDDPVRLFIFSQTKTWKTASAMQLPNNLVIDLESWSKYYSWLKVDVKQYAKDNNISLIQAFSYTIKAIKASEHKYDYITIDTVTALEDIACEYALQLYKESSIWKNYKWTNILNLPQWAGYAWLREAFEKIYMSLDWLYNKWIIFLWHVKSSSILKDWESISARDINLTGKLKYILSADVDAIWYLYRNKETNQNYISFKTTETDLACWARPQHLKGKEFIFSEEKDWVLVTYRDSIYLSLRQWSTNTEEIQQPTNG